MLKHMTILTVVLAVYTWILGGSPVHADDIQPDIKAYYVAPEALGKADGSTADDAAYFREFAFWFRVQRSLQTNPVTVFFMPGQYIFSKSPKGTQSRDTLKLEYLGNVEHQLVIQGLYKEGTVFTSDPSETVDQKKSIDMFVFNGKNTVIRNLHFTGQQHMGYATRFLGQNILIEDCTWVDLPRVYYGATGTANATTQYITFKNCLFKRVGLDSHAHMIYNAYGPQHIYVINSYFEDSSGEYVRFRDRTDYVVVYGSTFKSTGTYVGGNNPFVTVPLFNDDDPSKPKANPGYEYFGTHILVANNTFIYPDNNTGGTRQVFRFLQSGFDPPGRRLLLDAKDAKVLMSGTVEDKRALMKQNLGIEGEHVHFFGNTYVGQGSKNSVVYYAYPNYGAAGRGWSSPIDITDAVNQQPVVGTATEAMSFWKSQI